MTPTGSETGGRNGALLVELGLALRNGNLPYKLFDSSTGFRLRDGPVRSLDASLVAVESWRAQATMDRAGLRHCVRRWPLSGQRRQARLAAEPLRIEAATSLDGAPQMPGLTTSRQWCGRSDAQPAKVPAIGLSPACASSAARRR